MMRAFLIALAASVLVWLVSALVICAVLPVVHREWPGVPALSYRATLAVLGILWLVAGLLRPVKVKS